MRKTIVQTGNKYIYQGFKQLQIWPEVTLSDVKKSQVDRILKNINRHGNVVSSESFGDRIILKKMGQLNYEIYFR